MQVSIELMSAQIRLLTRFSITRYDIHVDIYRGLSSVARITTLALWGQARSNWMLSRKPEHEGSGGDFICRLCRHIFSYDNLILYIHL